RFVQSAALRCDPPPFPTRRSSDLELQRVPLDGVVARGDRDRAARSERRRAYLDRGDRADAQIDRLGARGEQPGEDGVAHHLSRTDRKSTRLNSSHQIISYAVFCLK